MTYGMLFWVLVILGFFFSAWASWPINRQNSPNLILFILIILLGIKVFGPALHG